MRGGVLLICLVVAVAACAASTTTPASGVTIASAPGETLGFEPAETTIRRRAGLTTITFVNRSSLPHNLVFTARVTLATRTIVDPGTSDQLSAPTSPGSYPFACTIHDGMTGTLIVVE